MAAITSNEDFSLAVGYLVDNGQLPVTGERQIDATARKVYDRRPGELVDITPAQAALEAALDAAQAALALEAARVEAVAALTSGRRYLRTQLEMATPATVTVIVGNIKPIVDGNVILTRMVNNQIDLLSLAFGWTAANVKTPTTSADRGRYITAVEMIIALV